MPRFLILLLKASGKPAFSARADWEEKKAGFLFLTFMIKKRVTLLSYHWYSWLI